MKRPLINALIALLKVKTLITLTVMSALVWGFCTGRVSVEVFIPVVTMVLTNYFRKDKGE